MRCRHPYLRPYPHLGLQIGLPIGPQIDLPKFVPRPPILHPHRKIVANRRQC